jgi:hypothetical protein
VQLKHLPTYSIRKAALWTAFKKYGYFCYCYINKKGVDTKHVLISPDEEVATS